MSDVACVINGVRRSLRGDNNVSVAMSARARSTMRGNLVITDASWRPEVGQEIALWSDTARIGGARSFDGTTSYLTRAFSSGTTDNWTIGIWARADTTGAQRFAFIVGDASDGYGLYVTSTGYWGGVLAGLVTLGGTAVAVTTGAWTHIVLRRASGTSQLFVNGVAAGSTTATTPNAPNGFITVGARRNAAGSAYEQFWDGDLAHGFVIHDDLTNAQIGQLYQGGPSDTGRALDAIATGTFWYYPITGEASPEPDTAASTSLTVTSATAITDGPLVISSTADVLFGGDIEDVDEGGLGGYGVAPLFITITASDFNGYADRITRASLSLSSESVADRLDSIVAAVPLFTSLTVASDQPTGPTLVAREAAPQRMTEFFDELREESAGYIMRIDAYKTISMRLPSTVAAPFDIDTTSGPSDVVDDIRVRTRYSYGYASFLRVYFGTGTRTVTDTFTDDGSTDDWTLTLPYDSITAGTVLVNGVTNETLSVNVAGGQWVLTTSTRNLLRVAGNLTNGHTVAITYVAKFPAEATSYGPTSGPFYGAILELPDVFSLSEANTQGSAYFDVVSVLPRVVTYATYEPGLRPGQLQHITVPTRGESGGLDHDCVITAVDVSTVGNRFKYRVTASTEGVTEDWRDVWNKVAS